MQEWLQEPAVRLLAGLLGSGTVTWAAWRKQSLSGSGALAAIGVGTITVAAGGAAWFSLVLAFFISSSLLTRWKQANKAAAETAYAKGGRRDAGQVLANGGIAAGMCALTLISGLDSGMLYAGFAGALAAATADTWATEIGGLSRRKPIHILTGKRVPAGTSGGITLLGCAAAIGGALLIAVSAALLSDTGGIGMLLTIVAAGAAGAAVDSVVGAVWQRMYRCGSCGRIVERSEHCGQPTKPVRGLSWMNNDAVNGLCTAAGACAGIILHVWQQGSI
ncbi:DUF92 domain-containing protein [Xylanibacillus composti]|uniref:DUF92 domain-containing protein n=1 Tax=Xylanibacillus composti TaxID=1572762 RepID=A0A8J4H2D9_9BACL|nr:DUF92 domain-containing protein [Xylanibacillus composti]MDT9724935.1 DUF92 domain-containing protein [Xylanibacillus composti]GIQ68171.1 DUF92 domain-containing protein [Xylanibacillus composti]